MPIRCRYENDGHRILLREINSPGDALGIHNWLVDKGISKPVIEADEPKGFRVSVAALPLDSFLRLIAGSEIELSF